MKSKRTLGRNNYGKIQSLLHTVNGSLARGKTEAPTILRCFAQEIANLLNWREDRNRKESCPRIMDELVWELGILYDHQGGLEYQTVKLYIEAIHFDGSIHLGLRPSFA